LLIAPSLRSARRSDWRDLVFGEESVAPVRLFFRAGVVESKQDENVLAAQIHHLIRKQFCHLSRKIILT